MVRQASEGLRADNAVVAFFNQFRRLAREQPTFSHLYAAVDHALCQPFDVLKRGGGNEFGVRLQRIDDALLPLGKDVFGNAADQLFDLLSAVVAVFHLGVREEELEEAEHPRDHVFAPLREQEFLQPVVSEGGVFDIDFAYNSDLAQVFLLARDIVKILCDGGKIPLHVAGGQPLFRAELPGQLVHPFAHRAFGFARVYLIRQNLILQQKENVAVNQTAQPRQNHARGNFEAAVFFDAAEAERQHGNIVHSHVVQCLAEQTEVIGGTATAAGLELNQCGLVRVEIAAGERVNLLPDHADGGVAHIVVHILQARVDNLLALVLGDDKVVAVHPEDFGDQLHMRRKDIRRNDGVGLLHFFCEIHNFM